MLIDLEDLEKIKKIDYIKTTYFDQIFEKIYEI